MEDTYVIVPRDTIESLALVAIALHEFGLSEEEVADLLGQLASNEEILAGIADFIEEHSVGSFDINTIMKETNLG